MDYYSIDWVAAQDYGVKAAIIIGILIVTWLLAKIAKWMFASLVNRVELLQRSTGSGESVGASLGQIVSLLIWLLGMIAILQQLGLDNVIRPLQTLLDQIMAFIPNIIGAAVIMFVGLVVARIARQLVETSLSTLNLDAWAARGGVDQVTGNNTISKTIATIVFVLIIIPIAIAALQALQISAISDPATQMLQTVLNSIPLIIGAVLLLGIAFFIARWVGGLIEQVLPDLGFDRAVHGMGIFPAETKPSMIVSRIASTAIMLFFAIEATKMLNFGGISAILNNVLEIGARVVFGSVIIAVGFLLANLIAGIVKSSAQGGSMGPMIVRFAIMGLFAAIGLSQMGIGGPIVEIAFSAIVIAAAVAGALAFGLGGRDAAAKVLERMQDDK
ncbi:MAG: mechanosensitive ion channel [Sphingomonadaceae bacterium]